MISKNRMSHIRKLHNKKVRDEEKLFLVEGVKAVKELLELKPQIAEEIFATKDFVESNGMLLLKSKVEVTVVNNSELERISAQVNPNEVLALCHYFDGASVNFDFDKNFTLYLDDIRDPGNFGTIMRLADWFGIEQIYCSPNSCDFYNPKVIQSTMGAFLRVKVDYIELGDLIERQKIKRVYGALLQGENIYQQKLSGGLIVIGNESNGISRDHISFVSHPVSIPSHPSGGAESLNAAMAASIITSEFFRQLNFSG